MKQTEKEFAALVKEQKSTIYSICYMFSKDKEEIDDLFQETLIHWKERIVYRVFLILVIAQFMVNRYDNGMFEFTMLDKVLFACLILVALLDFCFPE